MSYWETAHRHNFAEKALALLEFCNDELVQERDLECTLALAATTMLFCNSRDSAYSASLGGLEARAYGAASIPTALIEQYRRRVDQIPQLCAVARSRRQPARSRFANAMPDPASFKNELEQTGQRYELGELLRRLRNALAHGGVAWASDTRGDICGVLLVIRPQERGLDWTCIYLPLADLMTLVRWWAKSLLASPYAHAQHLDAIERQDSAA
jgi:hypothetical protein